MHASTMPQLEVIGLWLIGIGSFVAMVGLVIQTPRGLDGRAQGVASRRARVGYAGSAGGAVWTAVGGLLVATENVPGWGGWVALTLVVIAVTAWLAGAAIYYRDARKLLAEATRQPDSDRTVLRTKQADWRSALRWPFGNFT
jgi:hypothetical protein